MGSIASNEDSSTPGSLAALLLMLLVFLPVAAAVFGPGLSAPFISDDHLYIVNNPYVREFNASMLSGLFDPSGDGIHFAGGNYAPIHVLAHAVEWKIFGEEVLGYHLVNVALHCLNAVLLAALLLASGIGRTGSTAAAALFLLHPANVEAVVWISQLKSLLALGFAMAALLLFRERPLWAALPFVLGLLSKATAAFALPFAAAMLWCWYRAGTNTRHHALTLVFWALATLLFAIPQLAATAAMGSDFVPEYADVPTHLRTIFAIGARYLAMAGAAYGLASYHEPPPSSFADPWWWIGVVSAVLLVARIVWTLRRGREEAAWWIAAVAAFAPISQWIPFYFGMADRYLYFILPGLIGGTLLCGARFRGRTLRYRRPLQVAAIVCIGILGLRFATLSTVRSQMWHSDYRLLRDAARRYPNGATASYTRALIAMKEGDGDEALERLREAADRELHFVRSFQAEPLLAPLQADPRFEILIREIARRQIEVVERRGITSQRKVIGLAQAYFLLGEHDHAIELLEATAREDGPLHSQVLYDLILLRGKRAELRRSESME